MHFIEHLCPKNSWHPFNNTAASIYIVFKAFGIVAYFPCLASPESFIAYMEAQKRSQFTMWSNISTEFFHAILQLENA